MAQGINMTTEIRTDASLNKTSTDTNDSNTNHTTDDTCIDNVSESAVSKNAGDVSNTMINEAIDIGGTLKEKRLQLGFDEKHVANELKISIDQVLALEDSNFNYFRSVTFARGFLKSYCRLLELDHIALVEAFDSRRADAGTTIKPVDKVHKQTHLGDPIVIFTSVVIVSVLVFLVFWWPTTISNVTSSDDSVNEIDESETVSEEPSIINTTLESAETSIPSVVVPVDATNQISSIEATTDPVIVASPSIKAADMRSVDESDVVTDLSADTLLKEADISQGKDVLSTKSVSAKIEDSAVETQITTYVDDVEIAFNEDCWTEIRDASGTILFSGVKSAGSTLALTSDAPYRVVLGYVSGVSFLKYKGELFDFSSFTRKNLARFELK